VATIRRWCLIKEIQYPLVSPTLQSLITFVVFIYGEGIPLGDLVRYVCSTVYVCVFMESKSLCEIWSGMSAVL